jgi:acyl transferase domain-containing protein
MVVIAGGLTYELGLELVTKRSEILRSDPAHPGGMAIVAASKGTITELLRHLGLEGRLVIAVYNGSQSHVVSGELVALDVFLLTAKNKGLRASKLKVTQGEYIQLISCDRL